MKMHLVGLPKPLVVLAVPARLQLRALHVHALRRRTLSRRRLDPRAGDGVRGNQRQSSAFTYFLGPKVGV